MPRKKKKKPSTAPDKLKHRQEVITNFYIQRLIKACDDPQEVWELTKDPDNIFRPDEQELKDILAELEYRLLSGTISQEVSRKIFEGINYE